MSKSGYLPLLIMVTTSSVGWAESLPNKAAPSAAATPPAVQATASAPAAKKEEPKPKAGEPPVTAAAPTPAKTPDPNEQLKNETAKLTAEKDRLAAEIALAQAKLEKELSSSKLQTARLQAQLAELKAQQELADFQKKVELDKHLVELRRTLERVTLEANIVKAESDTEMLEIRRLENGARRQTAQLAVTMELEQKKAEARTYASKDPIYLQNPLEGRKLTLSDRRIALNGPITMNSADEIAKQISYYNNRDRKLPIFIVIDQSPGGSVMAGYKILKAMEGSDAPVHVVVKSFAASMAACITALADKSFAYPNAIILHHQISSFSMGNLTQQQEWVKELEEWWKRLAGPVADKMGLTREEFIKRMYARSSSGDWSEFGDQAQALKWVDVIVDDIVETGTVRHPESGPPPAPSPLRMAESASTTPLLQEHTDAKGRPCMTLPRLAPLDAYWLYNPDGYYRLP